METMEVVTVLVVADAVLILAHFTPKLKMSSFYQK